MDFYTHSAPQNCKLFHHFILNFLVMNGNAAFCSLSKADFQACRTEPETPSGLRGGLRPQRAATFILSSGNCTALSLAPSSRRLSGTHPLLPDSSITINKHFLRNVVQDTA